MFTKKTQSGHKFCWTREYNNASFINIKLPDMPQFYVNNIRALETAHERIKGNAFVKWFT